MARVDAAHKAISWWRDVRQYILLWAKALYSIPVGMWVTVRVLFTKPFTLQYPEEEAVIFEGFRGLHEYEQEKCIACNMCVQVCPPNCIRLEAEGKGKAAKVLHYQIDYQYCMFCNFCAEVCPTKCVWLGKEFDLSVYKREEAVSEFAGKGENG